MRNRAKCKLCESIIESKHRHDMVHCTCNEIFVDGGTDYFRAGARDFINFIRLDDDGTEHMVTFKEDDEPKVDEVAEVVPEKVDHLAVITDMIQRLDTLPEHALQQPLNQYDMYSILILLQGILKSQQL